MPSRELKPVSGERYPERKIGSSEWLALEPTVEEGSISYVCYLSSYETKELLSNEFSGRESPRAFAQGRGGGITPDVLDASLSSSLQRPKHLS